MKIYYNLNNGSPSMTVDYSSDDLSKKVLDEIERLGFDYATRQGFKLSGWVAGCKDFSGGFGDATLIGDNTTLGDLNYSEGSINAVWSKGNTDIDTVTKTVHFNNEEFNFGGKWGGIIGSITDQEDLVKKLGKKANSSEILSTINPKEFTPTTNYHPATKKYVDDKFSKDHFGNGLYVENDIYSMTGYLSKYDYSAMRGPCPEGYHIPTGQEWQNIIDILKEIGIGTDGRKFAEYLKLPNGYRDYSNGNVTYGTSYASQGLYAASNYSTRTCYTLVAYRGGTASYYSSYLAGNKGLDYGHQIRGFKNECVIPDSSWTIIFDGSDYHQGSGIFWNQSLGVISISRDGKKWYTIADKNIGASSVDSRGYFYQRGNNYGFPVSGSITTSSTRVDATNYGPGNYYSSSTFITGSTSWDTSTNKNLWGGETGVLTNDKNIITGDGSYNLVISSSIPASGTSNNTITISTGTTKGLYIGTTKIA